MIFKSIFDSMNLGLGVGVATSNYSHPFSYIVGSSSFHQFPQNTNLQCLF